MWLKRILALGLFCLASASSIRANTDLNWQPWSADLFAKAKAENRLVILDLEAVWCHWCHVMEKTTYSNPDVAYLLKSKFITVRVDQDANPDLSNRYGDWGWPATIIFAPDGTEIVKRAGYIEPKAMTALLEAVIADPTPGPSVINEAPAEPSKSHLLSAETRAELAANTTDAFDTEYGGWGTVHKFIDADRMDWELALAASGDKAATSRAQKTFTAALNLIDTIEGGIYQYSDAEDWKSPHYEKIMWYQANSLRQYAQAYTQWREPKYLEAATNIKKYLMNILRNTDGAFFTSQDADVSEAMPGKNYYALTQAERDALPAKPRVDQHVYARENGWAIRGLVSYFAASGDTTTLDAAKTAAEWILKNRKLAAGGFAHGDADRGGPFLGDTLSMGQAALDLYAATGDRKWLVVASEAGDFITAKFQDSVGGFVTSAQSEANTGVFAKPAKIPEEQIQTARFANLLNRYTGEKKYIDLAEHAARYALAANHLDRPSVHPGALLIDAELAKEPTHITIVGQKDDPRSTTLHAAALAFPAAYRRIDWWDKREGAMINPDVQYPELDEPAAFACTDRICSLPVFDPAELANTVNRMVRRSAETGR
jgi:uncharacterized protein